MRFEMIEISPGLVKAVPYVECWRCGEDVLETDQNARGLCLRCNEICTDWEWEEDS